MSAKQLALAEKLYFAMHVIQGSYQAASSYSGTSHTGGGVMDTGPGSFMAQDALRRVGFAAWARNIPGAAYAGKGAHVHSVSRIDPAAAGHAQLSSFARGEDGLGHADYGPNPPLLPDLSKLLGGIDLSNVTSAAGLSAAKTPEEKEKDGWLERIKAIPEHIMNAYKSVKTMATDPNGFYPVMYKGARGIGHDAVQGINDKIPDKIDGPKFLDLNLPNNPIPNPFDRGGIAQGQEDVWMPKRTAQPERVLSPKQTSDFERLVNWLEKNQGFGRGGGDIKLDVHVPQEASARDVVDGIVYEMRRLQMGGRY
jgi:hypothetical protein